MKTLISAVVARSLVASLAFGFYRLIRKPVDAFFASEAVSKVFGKAFQDEASAQDFAEKSLGKASQESSELSDQTVWEFTKASSDSGFAQDEVQSFSISMAKQDTVNVTDDVDGEASILDDQTINFLKVRQEVSIASDELTIILAYVRAFEDQSSVSENKYILIEKPRQDVSGVTDEQSFDVGKDVRDVSQFSDGQVLSISKLLAENQIIVDLAAIDLEKAPVQDAFSVGESISLGPNKAREEACFVGDEIQPFGFGKGLFDAPLFQDVITFSSSKILSDQYAVSDLPAKAVSKSFAESVSSSDLIDYLIDRSNLVIDSSSLSEAVDFSIGKNLSEAPLTNEVVALSLSRSLIDNGSIIDQHVKSVIKGLVDQGSFVDSGQLRGQGYCDFDYFSEDYVGYSRTFT